MRKLFGMFAIITFIALMTVACGDHPFLVYNGCKGSWLLVKDGRGEVLSSRLEYGKSMPVPLNWYSGSTVYLHVDGFDLVTNYPLGSNSTSRYIERGGGGGGTGPSQMQPWDVTYLSTSDPNGGCRR